jgi:type IX secretion system PorP/SprF family membrane protein
MKLRTLISALIFSSLASSAQQGIFSNLYEYHPTLFNPALTATDGKSRLSMLGIYNSSNSLSIDNRFALTYEQPSKKLHGAFGLYLLNNQLGYSRSITGGLSYAYHAQLSPNLRLSAGLQAGIYSASLDPDLLRPIPHTISREKLWSTSLLNLNAGLSLHYKRSYIAYGSRQLTQPVLRFKSNDNSTIISQKLRRENYLQIGTVLGQENEQVNVMLSSLTYFSDGNSNTMLNMNAWIHKKFMIGASIFLNDNSYANNGLALNTGLELKKFRLLLSYQPNSSRLARGGYLSIGLAYRF